MLQEIVPALSREDHPDPLAHQLHTIPFRGNAIAELEIVRMIISNRLEAADFSKMSFGRGHRPSESELHVPLEFSRHQSARRGLGWNPQRVQYREHAARRHSPKQ